MPSIFFNVLSYEPFSGNSLLQLSLFAASILLTIIIGKILFVIIKSQAKKIMPPTKRKFDGLLLEAIDKQLLLILFSAGAIIGLKFLSLDTPTMNTISNLVWSLFTITIASVMIKLVDAFLEEYLVPMTAMKGAKIDNQMIPTISTAIKIIIAIIAIAILLNIFGYNVTAILAGLGIGGLAIAFAAQATIADVFGGISLLTSKPFRIGDTIQVDNITGTVKKIGIRTTRITGLDKSEITFSNAKLASSVIKNISSGTEQRVELNLGITYNTPAEKIQFARETIKKIILEHPGCANDPIIYFSDFKEFSLNIFIIYFIRDKDWINVRHEINMKIKEEFDKNKIEFAFPTQTVYLAK